MLSPALMMPKPLLVAQQGENKQACSKLSFIARESYPEILRIWVPQGLHPGSAPEPTWRSPPNL